MPHDFKKFPELTNKQMEFYYFQSPHKQITENFRAKVIKVIDGDTVRVRVPFRNFDFPIRLSGINAPEMNEDRGKEVKKWLEGIILNQEVEVLIDKTKRVGKWGRILGIIKHGGLNINDWLLQTNRATTFEKRNEGKIQTLGEYLA